MSSNTLDPAPSQLLRRCMKTAVQFLRCMCDTDARTAEFTQTVVFCVRTYLSVCVGCVCVDVTYSSLLIVVLVRTAESHLSLQGLSKGVCCCNTCNFGVLCTEGWSERVTRTVGVCVCEMLFVSYLFCSPFIPVSLLPPLPHQLLFVYLSVCVCDRW